MIIVNLDKVLKLTVRAIEVERKVKVFRGAATFLAA
jgi:hypothetical protein